MFTVLHCFISEGILFQFSMVLYSVDVSNCCVLCAGGFIIPFSASLFDVDLRSLKIIESEALVWH